MGKSNERSQYYKNDSGNFSIHLGDSLSLLTRVPTNSVDMIFADPPYFLSNGGMTCRSGKMESVHKGTWDISSGIEEDFKFQVRWLKECQRILKPDGTIWVSGTRHVIFSIGFAMQGLGFKLLNDIVWYKRNPPPNLSCRYFTHSTETIIWAGKTDRSRHTFHYQLMKEWNEGKQMKSLWNILPPRKEEKLQGKHPTQKPVELLERIILSCTNPGDLVLDPFSGSGTTGVVSAMHGRRYIGMELNPEYADLSVRRYLDVAAQMGVVAPAQGAETSMGRVA